MIINRFTMQEVLELYERLEQLSVGEMKEKILETHGLSYQIIYDAETDVFDIINHAIKLGYVTDEKRSQLTARGLQRIKGYRT